MTVSLKPEPGKPVTFTRDSIPNRADNTMSGPDGLVSYRSLMEANGHHVLGAAVGEDASPSLSIEVKNGQVVAGPDRP